MIANFLFSPATRRRNSIGGLTIETTLFEGHTATSRSTLQPVERGSSISDHIVNDPEIITITGFISDTPITGGQSNNSQLAFDVLYSIRDRKDTVSVVTNFRVYQNMALTSIDIPRRQNVGQAIEFTVELTKIRTAGEFGMNSPEDIFGSPTVTIVNQVNRTSTIEPADTTAADQAPLTQNIGRFLASPIGTSGLNALTTQLGR